MSVEAFARALTARVGNPTRKLILMGYANHAHRDGRNAWCSIGTVADYAECDHRTAQRHVAALLADGFMREGDQEEARRRSTRAGNRLPIVYDLAMDEPTRLRWRAERPPGGRRADHARAGAAGGRASAARRRPGPRGDNTPPPPPGSGQPAAGPIPQASRDDILAPHPAGGDNGTPAGVTEPGPRGDASPSPESSVDPPDEPPPDGRPAAGASAGPREAPAPGWDPDSVEDLAGQVTGIRPDWAAAVRGTLSNPALRRLAGGSWERACRAALAVAADPESRHPNRLLQPGRWWALPAPPTPGPAPCTADTGVPADYQPGPGQPAAQTIANLKAEFRSRYGADLFSKTG